MHSLSLNLITKTISMTVIMTTPLTKLTVTTALSCLNNVRIQYFMAAIFVTSQKYTHKSRSMVVIRVPAFNGIGKYYIIN